MSSPEDVPGYFKSSFARSMAFSSDSKSLDAEREATPPPVATEKPQVIVKPSPRRSVPSIPTYDSMRESFRRPRNDPIKFWKMKQESGGDMNGWVSPLGPASQSSEEEILRLRKECQGLMESNRKLQQGGTNMDVNLLQSQVDTLQWQLKQAESSRQMYRAVMEQVSKFLERVHKALEAGTKAQGPRAKHRVPRSRSVHTVANGTTNSRASSPSPSTSSTVHRASSISQIQDSYSTWRSSRVTVVEETVSPEKLSQEAFRLLRTIQSLLNTREPDLARLSDHEHSSCDNRDSTSMGSCSSLVLNGGCREENGCKQSGPATPQLSVGSTEDESGFSSMSSFHDAQHADEKRSDFPSKVTSTPFCNSDFPSKVTSTPFCNSDEINVTLRRASFQSNTDRLPSTDSEKSRYAETIQVVDSTPPRPPPHSRTLHEPSPREARSSSFQATESFPPLTNPRSFHELGLPLVDAAFRHRRWSSTPVDNPSHPDSLRVLWV